MPFKATPQTIVLTRKGTVLRSWTGAYAGEVRREIEEYFDVVLPPLMGGRQKEE
jgi:hypothetical protein